MLIWNTQIPVIPTHSTDDLLNVAKKWLIGSPHFSWEYTDIGDTSEQGIAVFNAHDQRVSIARFRNENGEFCGLRHEREDAKRLNWTTEICGWRTDQKFLVSVQVFCETTNLGLQLPQLKRPIIVRQILDDLGGDLDGTFPVSNDPIILNDSDLDLAVRILNGETQNFLPVVYASSTWKNEAAFNSKELAKSVSGMAHVVVEPTRQFSFQLALRVSRKNPYEGAVAICWPNSDNRQSRLYPYHFEASTDFAAEIANVIRQTLAGSRPDYRCTWAFIRELAFTYQVKTLRHQGKTDVDGYIKAFDKELSETRKQLEGAEQEVGRLKAELSRSQRATRTQEDGLLATGKEQDLYAGEHRDTILYALKLAKSYVIKDGRVSHVLDSLLAANKTGGEGQRLQEAIRTALAACTNAGSKERRALEDLGFSVTEEGKHLKLVFRGDDRYTFAMPKSGSDHRGMLNWVSKTIGLLFR